MREKSIQHRIIFWNITEFHFLVDWFWCRECAWWAVYAKEEILFMDLNWTVFLLIQAKILFFLLAITHTWFILDLLFFFKQESGTMNNPGYHHWKLLLALLVKFSTLILSISKILRSVEKFSLSVIIYSRDTIAKSSELLKFIDK